MSKVDRRSWPKTVAGAKKKGWSVVRFNRDNYRKPWMWFSMDLRMQSEGAVVSLYNGSAGGEVLFENASSAMFAAFKYRGELV